MNGKNERDWYGCVWLKRSVLHFKHQLHAGRKWVSRGDKTTRTGLCQVEGEWVQL